MREEDFGEKRSFSSSEILLLCAKRTFCKQKCAFYAERRAFLRLIVEKGKFPQIFTNPLTSSPSCDIIWVGWHTDKCGAPPFSKATRVITLGISRRGSGANSRALISRSGLFLYPLIRSQSLPSKIEGRGGVENPVEKTEYRASTLMSLAERSLIRVRSRRQLQRSFAEGQLCA